MTRLVAEPALIRDDFRETVQAPTQFQNLSAEPVDSPIDRSAMAGSARPHDAAGDRRRLTVLFEITGSVLAMAYALLVASNIGAELAGFSLLLVSSGLFAAWAAIDRRWTFLMLQFFYAVSAVIGLVRWG